MTDPIRPVRPPARKRKRPRNPSPEVRTRLLEAASSLIDEGGISRLRIDDVAERAGLSVGTVYLYFEGKDDLFSHVVIELTRVLRERLRIAYEGEGPLLQRLVAALDTYLDFVEEKRQGFLHFRDAGAVHTTGGRLSVWALNQHVQDMRPVLEAGMEQGEVRRTDPELLAQACLGLLQHMAGVWIETSRSWPREEFRRFLLQATYGLIRP